MSNAMSTNQGGPHRRRQGQGQGQGQGHGQDQYQYLISNGAKREMEQTKVLAATYAPVRSSATSEHFLRHQPYLPQQQQHHYQQPQSQQPISDLPFEQELPPPHSQLQPVSNDMHSQSVQPRFPPQHLSQINPVPPIRTESPLSFLSLDNDGAKYDTNPRHVTMKKWIDGALHSLENAVEDVENNNNNNNMKKEKISSGPYLISALKIANSLASQLCKLEQEEQGNEGETLLPPPHCHVPPEGLQWPDLVTVHLKSDKDEDSIYHNEMEKRKGHEHDGLKIKDGGEQEDHLEDDDFSGKFHPVEEARPQDMIAGLLPEIFINDQKYQQGTRKPENYFDDPFELGPEACDEFGEQNKRLASFVDYLNISYAEIRMDKQNTHTSSDLQEDKRMRIYYLGLVFFQLFSGGQSPTSKREFGTDPLVNNMNSQSTDLHAMSILDEIGEDDELFGGINMGLDESAHSLDNDANRNKRLRNVEENYQERKATHISVEPLKSMGLPVSLCDLIRNMIDCAQGDFSDDEAYSCMLDVQTDLKLMLENPDIYLSDLDLDLLCKVGLQMDKTATGWGREAEFASLKQAYICSTFDNRNVAIICGPQGAGKSSLAKNFAQYARRGDEENNMKECIVLSGKFDKLHQSNPFSPVVSAFNKYCEWLSSSDKRKLVAENISSTLKLVLGQEVTLGLSKIIPELSKVIGVKPDMKESDGFEDVQKRLGYLLSQFVEVISRSHGTPLLLFVDNLEYSDSASIAVIKQILLASRSRSSDTSNQFFFLGCCSEMGKDHGVWKMLHSISDFGVNITRIEMGFMDKETVNLMVSKKLKMLPRLTLPLTDIIYHKTKGNPFFLGKLMIELSTEGLLRPSLSQRRWVWDEEKIQERELPDDVVAFLTDSLSRLPSEVRSALSTLSCFGSSSDRSLVELDNELELSLSGPLDKAVAEGFLNRKDGKYSFVDDRVKESAYNLMKPEDRCLHHIKYGLALCAAAKRKQDDGLFLIAVGQINMGGPKAVADKKEGLKVAKYNLAAGKKATAMSDLISAYWFFDYGISYLKRGHWESEYELSLELYNGAAECALSIGEMETLSILSEQIMRSAKCVEDKLIIFDITIRLLLYRSDVVAAVGCAKDALRNLGEEFPEDVTPDVLIHFIEETKELLDGMANEELINLKLMTDTKTIMAMKYLARLSEALYIFRPGDQPIVVLRMVQLSLTHGMSPLSPLAFVSYGSFLASSGDIREGYRYARIATAQLDKVGQRVAGQVIAYSTQLKAYVEPVQSAIEFHIEGGKAAMICGQISYLLLNSLLYDSCSFWSGKKLKKVISQLEQTISTARQGKHVLLLGQIMPLYGSVSNMIGLPDNRDMLHDLRVGNTFNSKAHYFNNMYTAFMFRNYEDMKSAIEQYSKYKIGSWIFVFSSSVQLFYEGLISFFIGRKENDNTWIERGETACRAIESFSDSSSKWNFENKALLLQAEEQFCSGKNLELAGTLYDKAVLSAKEHRFLNEEALALELAGIFHLKTGGEDRAIKYLSEAVEKYKEWEAFAKAKSLERYLEQVNLKITISVAFCSS